MELFQHIDMELLKNLNSSNISFKSKQLSQKFCLSFKNLAKKRKQQLYYISKFEIFLLHIR